MTQLLNEVWGVTCFLNVAIMFEETSFLTSRKSLSVMLAGIFRELQQDEDIQ